MAGRKRLGLRFKNATPWWCQLIVGLLLADSVIHVGLLLTVSSWASSSRDAVHSYRVPFRDGNIYFVQTWVGTYLNTWWIGVGLLALLAVLLVLNRNLLERPTDSI